MQHLFAGTQNDIKKRKTRKLEAKYCKQPIEQKQCVKFSYYASPNENPENGSSPFFLVYMCAFAEVNLAVKRFYYSSSTFFLLNFSE